MSKYLIETNDTDLDDRSDELIQRMIDEGTITLSSASVDVGVTVTGKATEAGFNPLPGGASAYYVKPLT